MKHKLIGLLIFLAGFANAQIGIDLTEMIPAPDSGYMIITTGDEYPDRGLQKYVKASDVLGLDTFFQQGDSLCLLFRHEENYRCFPVHRAPRFQITDEGLRVCWEQRDTLQREEYWLHFSDEGRPSARARSLSDLEIGDQDADIEIRFRTEKTGTTYIGGSSAWLSSEVRSGYSFGYAGSGLDRTMISDGTDWIMNFSGNNDQLRDGEWHSMRMKWTNSIGEAILFVDGVSIDTVVNEDMIGKTLNNYYRLVLGRDGSLGANGIIGDISYFRFNDELFNFREQYGDITIGSKGTILDLDGAEWNYQPLIIDTTHHCEVIPLTDKHLINVEHIGDSVRYTLSDSTIFTVRDSFIPQENIIGWIDERIPDTVFFAKTSTATKAIEFGDTLELKGGAININIPVEIDYFPNTNQLEICWTEIELPDQGLQDEGMGSEFNQGGGQVQQLPADTIRLCDTIQLNDVFIDTVFHDGDSLRFVRNDGKTWAVRDSFRTDDEILDLIEMMYDPQWLDIDRDGNEVTISISDGNSISFIDSVRSPGFIADVMRDSIIFPVDTFVTDFFRDGDSIRLTRSDGADWAVLDSVRSNAEIAEIARDSMPKESRIIADPVVLIPCDSVGVGSVSVELERKDLYPHLDSTISALNLLRRNDLLNHSRVDEAIDSFGDYLNVPRNFWANQKIFNDPDYDMHEPYTLSFLAMKQSVPNNNNPGYGFWYTDNTYDAIRFNNTDAPDWFTITSNPSKTIDFIGYVYSAGGEHKLYKIKLEKGSTATPWTPHPYDAISIHPHNATATLDSGRLEISPEAPTGWVDVHVDYGTYQDSVRIPFATLCDTDLTGIRDTLSDHDTRLLSLEYFRDTLGIPDIASFAHSGDSIHLTMNDGRSWVVPDLHFTEQEIKDLIAQESPVNHSWLLKDGGVPDNASDTVYREGVAVIEGDRWNKTISSNSLDLRSTSPIWLPSYFLRAFVEDENNPIIADQIYSTPFSSERILSVSKRDFSESTAILLDSRSGIRFQPYGSGKFESTPTYLLGVDASGFIKEVRPTSGIDTIIHLGDSIFFDFDDKTFTIRDSVRSDAEIISLIEANRIFQQLGRSGDFITLTDGGQVLDLHLKNVTHTGDSIRLHLSDGRILSTRDSSLSVDAVRDMILEEIPETVFYVKQGDVTAPVNWGDIVELENGTVNVNMPTKVKMIDSLNALEVCIWQVVDRTVVDTAIMDYLYFNGVDAYGQSVLPNSDNPFDLPAGFRVSFDDPINQEQTLYSNGGEVNNNQFSIRIPTSLEDLSLRVSGSNIIRIDVEDLSPGEVDLIEYKPIGDNIGGYLNGELKDQIPGFNYPFVGVGARQLGRYNSSNPRLFKGKMYEFWWGDNHYPLTEGSGTTITSTTGAEFELFNTVWGKDTIITVNELIDTFFQCDTVYLKDWYVKNATFENDTLTLVRSDGIEMSVEIQASGGDGIDTMYSTQDSLYIVTSTGRTLSAGVAKGDKGDGLEYNWDGTRLGVRVENSGDPFVYVDLKGDKGDTGDDGREVELRVDSEMIQWRYVGDNWQNLLPLSALKGEKGDQGDGLEYAWDGTKLGVRVEGSGDPFVYVDLKGEKGDPGDVVGDINIYKDDGVILENRTATIEEDNTLKFDLKEKAEFEIGHYSQNGNDSKLINHRTSDNSFMLEIQEIEKDTLWNSRILATSKGIGLRNHKSYGSSISYGTMGIDTTGSYILNLVKDNPGVLFAGRRQFLNRVTDDGHALWDTLGIQDVGITPADTARWGAGGSYTLERDNYRMHLRDAGGASKGSFQLQGSDGVEIYPQANNVFRISGQGINVPSYTTQVSGPAFNLRRDNSTVSTVNFFGTGGINIGGTGSTITIDGSAIGGTQSLGFNPSLTQTTLSGGGGSFRIVGGANTNVSLSSGGVYTISSTAAGDTREIVRGGTNNDWIMMSGSSVGVIDRYVSGFSKSGNNITLNRTDGLGGVTFSIADGDSNPTNELQTLSHNTSTQTTTLSQSGGSFRLVGGTGVNISNTSGGVYTVSNSGDLVLKTEALNSGTATAAVIYASSTTGTITLPSGVSNGTVKYVINNSGGSKTINRGAGQTTTLNSSGAFGFIYYNIWWPMREP